MQIVEDVTLLRVLQILTIKQSTNEVVHYMGIMKERREEKGRGFDLMR
jgi:hypothetical protein